MKLAKLVARKTIKPVFSVCWVFSKFRQLDSREMKSFVAICLVLCFSVAVTDGKLTILLGVHQVFHFPITILQPFSVTFVVLKMIHFALKPRRILRAAMNWSQIYPQISTIAWRWSPKEVQTRRWCIADALQETNALILALISVWNVEEICVTVRRSKKLVFSLYVV